MRQCVIWLIFLQVCGSQYVDYSDYHPKNIPLQKMASLQSDDTSSEYNAVMTNLCNNWQSPISYLKKRGYMPAVREEKPEIEVKNQDDQKPILKGKNYFFFPQAVQQSLKENSVPMEEDSNSKPEVAVATNTNAPLVPSPVSESSEIKTDSSGIINKVRDKFLSIFTHNGRDDDNGKAERSDLFDWNYDIEDSEYLENPDEYELSGKRLFARSANEKSATKSTSSSNEDIFTNLNDLDIQYVKSFINCFKAAKQNFDLQPLTAGNTAKVNTTVASPDANDCDPANPSEAKPGDAKPAKPGDGKPGNSKLGDGKQSEGKSKNSKSGDGKPGNSKSGDGKSSKPADGKPGGAKSNETKQSVAKQPSPSLKVNVSTECIPEAKTPPTTPNPKTTTTTECIISTKPPPPVAPSTTTECNTEPTKTTPKAGSKTIPNDFTVDLDINQKNGTGEDARCACPPIDTTTTTTTNTSSQPTLPLNPIPKKYVIKSKFLAHLHHMVDEVGKPPHKPLDLGKIQDVIDSSKHPTVVMGDGKTTECAPLRLNDMSFDLEWNKMEKSQDKDRGKINILSFPYANPPPQPQTLAERFLQDVIAYPGNKEEFLKTPYGDNFLDSQQSLPGDVELPLKMGTKREAVLPSSASPSKKLTKLLSDIASLPDPEGDDEYYMDDDSAGSSRHRVKDRTRNHPRKKPKTKGRIDGINKSASNDAEAETGPLDADDLMKKGNDFNSFSELKDIQFRVNDEDEEAISKFISNLNSPPEVFSFDVDKFLRSAQTEIEPQAPGLSEFQSPEPRTFYEFMEAPAVEKERLPLIDAPANMEEEQVIAKRSRRPAGRKRDLLRQYIKGVSSALRGNLPDISSDFYKPEEDKEQRSPNLDSDMSFRTNNLVDGFSTNLDAMNYIKSNERDDFLDNFYLLNDGSSQIYDLAKQDPDVVPSDQYSPQSLEIDLELDKKFRDLGIGSYSGADKSDQTPDGMDTRNSDDMAEVNPQMEDVDSESVNDQY